MTIHKNTTTTTKNKKLLVTVRKVGGRSGGSRKRPDARVLMLQSNETDLAIWSALYEANLKRDIFESAAAIGIDASRELLFF